MLKIDSRNKIITRRWIDSLQAADNTDHYIFYTKIYIVSIQFIFIKDENLRYSV